MNQKLNLVFVVLFRQCLNMTTEHENVTAEMEFAYGYNILTIHGYCIPIRFIRRVELCTGWGDTPYTFRLLCEGKTEEEFTFAKEYLARFKYFLEEWKKQFAVGGALA